MTLLQHQLDCLAILLVFLLVQILPSANGQYGQVVTYTKGGVPVYYTFTTPPISYAPLPTGTIPNATDYWYSVHSADTPQLTPVSKDHASNSDAARLRAARLQEFGWTALTVLTSVFVGVAAVLIV